MAIDQTALEYWRARKKGKETVELEKSKQRASKPDRLPVEVIRQGNAANYFMGIKQIGSSMLLVGIPGDTATALHRRKDLQARIDKFTSTGKSSTRRKNALIKLKSRSNLSNAYLLSIFERGSPLRHQPPRSVLKASIFFKPHKQKISQMLAEAADDQLNGRESHAQVILKKVGIYASKVAREWFTNPANGWIGNAPSTVKEKGFDSPGLWSRSMRAAITYVIKENTK